MKENTILLLPSDRGLTETGVKNEMIRGNNIPLSKYKIINIFWEQCDYPYPHSTQRIELRKGSGIRHIRYMESVQDILSLLNQKNKLP